MSALENLLMTQTANPPILETATLAGGCFWCVEAVFEQLRGVRNVQSGLAAERLPHAT